VRLGYRDRVRQLLTWRLAAALGALALLALGVDALFAGGDQQGSITVAGPMNLDSDGEIIERKVDLIASVARFELSDDWSIGDDGLTAGFMDAVLDEARVVRIAPGTPGQSSCGDYTVTSGCVVLADLLGDAVVWFALMPQAPNETVELPPIIDLQDGFAIFESGMQIRFPPVIERDPGTCTDDKNIASFSDFLRRFGPNSVSIVSLESQQVTKVLCGDEYIAPSTDEYDGSLDARIVTDATTTPVESAPPVSEP
jgi:hypothetical protein